MYNFSYINNYIKFYSYINDEDYDEEEEEISSEFFYNSKFSKKSLFLRKTLYGVKQNTKLASLKRNKNLDINNIMINSWVKKGMKLNFLKHYNIFLKYFMFLISNQKTFFSEYPNTEFVYDLLNSKFHNYKLQSLLVLPLELLEHMFELKLKKLNKKMKKKFKKKYIYTIKYLHRSKRLKNTLNMFYFSSNFYKNKKYSERIFYTFLYIIFDTKNTPIFEKKLNVYKIALKFLKKK